MLLASVMFTAGHALSAADAPQDVVAAMQSALMEVWEQSEQLSAEQRYERLEPVLREAFNFGRMIEVAAGPAWARASPEEQAELQEAFVRYSIATYASRFSDYSGQRFEITGQRPAPRDLTLVETLIVEPGGGEGIPVTYVVSRETGRPQIVDAIFKGVSEMAIRRSDYRDILKRSGPRALAERLKQQADNLLQE
jgi:phospholipid transport system substrate-binding protein